MDKKLVREFKKFVDTNFQMEDYKIYSSYFGDVVLVRVFRFEPPDMYSSGLVNAEGVPLINESKRRIVTIGKVLGIGDKCSIADKLKVGDIVALSDNLISIQDNPAFIQYLIETNGEKAAGLEAVKPSPTINSYFTFRQQYGFVGNKFKEENDADDFFTFLFPTNFIKAKIEKKNLEQWILSNV